MIIYISMFIYVFIIGYIGRSYAQGRRFHLKYDSQITMAFAIMTMILPVFFIGMRTNYIDTKGYILGFEALNTEGGLGEAVLGDLKSPGWFFYQQIIKRFITKSGNVFIMITAIIQGIAVLKLYYKYSKDYAFSILLFFISCLFVNMMNGIRQFMAISLIIFFADYLFEKKYIKFLIVVLIACTIHMSAIVYIPALFIVHGQPWNRRTVIFSISMVLAIVFVDQFTGLLDSALESTVYAGYTQQFSGDNGSNMAHTLIASVPVIISIYKRRFIKYENNSNINIMINLSLMGFLFSLLANFTSGILIGRIPIYFTIFNYALYPWMFSRFFSVGNKKAMRVLCIVGYGAYAVYYMTHAWGGADMPYISDILGINTWH